MNLLSEPRELDPSRRATRTFGPPTSKRLWDALDWDNDDPQVDARSLLETGDRYTVGEELGRGGMGTVSLVRDNQLGRTVAMKRLLRGRSNGEELRRFLLEARLTSQLQHPNIVNVYEVGADVDGRPYFTMEYVRGNETLENVIERLREGDAETHRRYSFERRVQVVLQVARALQYAHDKGVVHRDVKPANIMVGPFGEILLLDWGLARITDSGGLPRNDTRPPAISDRALIDLVGDPAFTDPDALLGTPFYMAPEQLRDTASERSDVYSLAAVLYEFLSLRHYLDTGNGPSRELGPLFKQIVEQEPLPADEERDELGRRVPRELAALVARGLAKDPNLRTQSAELFANTLQGWLEGACTENCPSSTLLRGIHAWRRMLQDHPLPTTVLSMAVAATFFLSVTFTLSQLIGHL